VTRQYCQCFECGDQIPVLNGRMASHQLRDGQLCDGGGLVVRLLEESPEGAQEGAQEEAQPLSSFKLQGVLHQLLKLTPTELSEVKAAVDEKLAQHLSTIGAVGDLTDEEWDRLEGGSLIGCVNMVRERTGLGLRDSKAYVDRARAKGRRLPQ
jgi:hypothetical protein